MHDADESPHIAGGLPRSVSSRIAIGIMAAFCLSVLTPLVIVFGPSGSPPASLFDWALVLLLGQALSAAIVFLLLALTWAIAAPEWVNRIIQFRARLLILCGAFFLFGGGLVLGWDGLRHNEPVVLVLAFISSLFGLVIGWRTVRSAPLPHAWRK